MCGELKVLQFAGWQQIFLLLLLLKGHCKWNSLVWQCMFEPDLIPLLLSSSEKQYFKLYRTETTISTVFYFTSIFPWLSSSSRWTTTYGSPSLLATLLLRRSRSWTQTVTWTGTHSASSHSFNCQDPESSMISRGARQVTPAFSSSFFLHRFCLTKYKY